MCDICVMNAVKNKMLSRRNFLKTGSAVAASAAVGTTMGTPAMAAGHGSIEDMTHTLHEDFPTFFGESQFSRESIFNYAEHTFNLDQITINEHTGTHIDSPLHFTEDGTSVDEIPVSSLFAPLCIIDIAARAAEDADTQVTPDDLKKWTDANGDIPDGACVAMHSGWSPKVDTDDFRNFDGKSQHYPGFHIEATEMLLETGAGSIAVDTLSLDHGVSPDFATHYAWLPQGRFGIECLANLDRVPAAGATLVIGAPKHRRGTGGPARIFAMV